MKRCYSNSTTQSIIATSIKLPPNGETLTRLLINSMISTIYDYRRAPVSGQDTPKNCGASPYGFRKHHWQYV